MTKYQMFTLSCRIRHGECCGRSSSSQFGTSALSRETHAKSNVSLPTRAVRAFTSRVTLCMIMPNSLLRQVEYSFFGASERGKSRVLPLSTRYTPTKYARAHAPDTSWTPHFSSSSAAHFESNFAAHSSSSVHAT
eukprot:3446593-Pleurochrysis_carterae.AAC.4